MLNTLIKSFAHKHFKGVHELDKLGGLSPTQKESLRKDVCILLIDDRDSETMSETLARKQGFCRVKPVKECPDDALIKSYPIIIVDVDGVTSEDTNGLRFAKHVKERYPLKQVIISSGQLQLARYKNDLRDVHMLDGIYEKTKDNTEKLASLLDASIVNLYDPSYVWRNIRATLLRRGENVGSDTDIFTVAVQEHEFVTQVLLANNSESIVNLQWLDKLIKIGKLSAVVIELLSNIKAC